MLISDRTNGMRRGFLFEDLCAEILRKNGAEVQRNATVSNRQDIGADLLLNHENGEKTIVEIKAYQTRVPSMSMIERIIEQLKSIKEQTGYRNLMLIIGLPVKKEIKHRIKETHNVTVVDSNNLLYLIHENAELLDRYNEFISDIPEELKPHIVSEEIDLNYLFINEPSIVCFKESAIPNRSEQLISELKNIKTGKDEFLLYEKKCEEILRFLFIENLVGWHQQLRTEDELNRYDLVCRVKKGNEFWEVLINEFNSRYIVFEFKNYSDKVKQMQVYTTEKYLFQKALRNVCIMISRFGLDDNAITATKGILRESGKLIIDLCDNDLINMLNIKNNGELPSDYLFGILDKKLLMLSK